MTKSKSKLRKSLYFMLGELYSLKFPYHSRQKLISFKDGKCFPNSFYLNYVIKNKQNVKNLAVLEKSFADITSTLNKRSKKSILASLEAMLALYLVAYNIKPNDNMSYYTETLRHSERTLMFLEKHRLPNSDKDFLEEFRQRAFMLGEDAKQNLDIGPLRVESMLKNRLADIMREYERYEGTIVNEIRFLKGEIEIFNSFSESITKFLWEANEILSVA